MSKNTQDNTELVHWVYTREEWNTFLRWKNWRRGLLAYLLYRFWPGKKTARYEIRVTGRQVCINNIKELFNDAEHKLRRVHIREAGPLNVMEIVYQKQDTADAGEIEIPVPRGKLKEAIVVQETLSAYC